MITVEVAKTTYEKVKLKEHEAREVTKKYLRTFIYPGQYLREKDGVLCLYQDDPHHHHRHGSISEEFVRIATPDELHIVAVLEVLEAL